MQSNAIKLATFAVAVLGLFNQAFVFFGYVPPVPLDKVLHLTTEQLTVLFSFAIAFVPEVHKLAADVLAMAGAIINRDTLQANARYEALAQDMVTLRSELDRLKAPPAQAGRLRLSWLIVVATVAAAIAALGQLVACATPASTQQTLLVTCTTYADMLEALAPLRAAHKLSAGQVAAVDQAVAIAGPICTGPLPADSADALAKLSAAVSSMGAAAAPASAASR